MPEYNLLTEKWLDFTELDGERTALGIEQVLYDAHNLRNMSFQSPLFEGAMLRILLAILHRACDGPKNSAEWMKIYETGKFDHDTLKVYFDRFRDRFNLFDEKHPFYQTAGLKMDVGILSLKDLFPEIASGHNKTLFNHSFDRDEFTLSYADAAKGLITTQMYSLGGLFRKTTNLFGYQQRTEHASLVRGIPIYACGESLFETLVLNMLYCAGNSPIPATRADLNVPVWERDDNGGSGKTVPYGYLHILVPKNRHILLVGKNGIVTGLHMAYGEEPDQNLYTDPFFIRATDKTGKQYPKQLNIDRLLWRDTGALFSDDECPAVIRQMAGNRRKLKRHQMNCTCYAIANKDANPLGFRKEQITFNTALLDDVEARQNLNVALSLAQKIHDVLGMAVWTFFEALLGGALKDVQEQKRNMNDAKTLFWAYLELPFRQFLLNVDEENCVARWKSVLKKNAIDSFVHSKGLDGRSGAKNMQAFVVAERKLRQQIKKELDI